MAFSDYSSNPDANTTISVFVGEGCPPGNLNNALRRIAADGRLLSDQVQAGSASLPLTGGTLTGDINRQGRGGYLHHASGSLTSGQVHFLPVGSARPAAAEGVTVFYY